MKKKAIAGGQLPAMAGFSVEQADRHGKANESTQVRTMSSMGSASAGTVVKGETYEYSTRMRWYLKAIETGSMTSITINGTTISVAGIDIENADPAPTPTFTGLRVIGK